MSSRGALLGLVLAVPACNFSIARGWVAPEHDETADASQRADAATDAGLARWCREECAAEDDDTCTQVSCADAAVCVDDAPCDRCVACRDE